MKRIYSLPALRSLGVGGFIIYYLFFILSTPVFSQSPSSSFRSIPQLRLTKTFTRSYIPLSSNITLMTDNTTNNNSNNTLLIKDYLNSTRVLVGSNGKITDIISYYPYGSKSEFQNPNIKSNPNVQNPKQTTDKYFTGHRQLDTNLSLIHAGVRFYSPTLGTFITPDTVEGPNRYGYVANNPIMFNDPTGFMRTESSGPGKSNSIGLSMMGGNRVSNPRSIGATDIFNPERVDKDIPEGLSNMAMMMTAGILIGGGLYALPSLISTAALSCLGNPSSCMSTASTIGEVAIGDAMPPGASLVQMPNKMFIWQDFLDDYINTHDIDDIAGLANICDIANACRIARSGMNNQNYIKYADYLRKKSGLAGLRLKDVDELDEYAMSFDQLAAMRLSRGVTSYHSEAADYLRLRAGLTRPRIKNAKEMLELADSFSYSKRLRVAADYLRSRVFVFDIIND